MNPEFHHKVIKDLDTSGFGSEMRAARTFLGCDCEVTSGGSFFDRDRNRNREFDIDAKYTVPMPSHLTELINVGVRFVVDVKKTKRPWVVFKSSAVDFSEIRGFLNRPIFTENAPPNYNLGEFDDPIRRKLGWIGYGIHESFKDPKARSRWYSAFVAMYKATYHVLEVENAIRDSMRESAELEHFDPDWPVFFYFCRPLIVIEGVLLAAELDSTGAISVAEVEAASFNFSHRSAAYEGRSYRLDVVTLRSLGDYLDDWKTKLTPFAEHIVQITAAASEPPSG